MELRLLIRSCAQLKRAARWSSAARPGCLAASRALQPPRPQSLPRQGQLGGCRRCRRRRRCGKRRRGARSAREERAARLGRGEATRARPAGRRPLWHLPAQDPPCRACLRPRAGGHSLAGPAEAAATAALLPWRAQAATRSRARTQRQAGPRFSPLGARLTLRAPQASDAAAARGERTPLPEVAASLAPSWRRGPGPDLRQPGAARPGPSPSGCSGRSVGSSSRPGSRSAGQAPRGMPRQEGGRSPAEAAPGWASDKSPGLARSLTP